MGNTAVGIRWRNVPIPEAHVAGILVGLGLHVFVPRHLIPTLLALWIAGWTLVAAGFLLAAWAVRTAGYVDTEGPSELVTTGPYTYSRNPMYVAWTVLYVGIAFIVNTVWLFVLLPLVMIVTHIIVVREERWLERAFGDAYREYKNDVRRYL